MENTETTDRIEQARRKYEEDLLRKAGLTPGEEQDAWN